MKEFFLRWLITALSVIGASHILSGISYSSFGTLLEASLLLGILNALVRPFMLFLSFPLIILTMGIFIFVINALLLLFVSSIIPSFHVDGFWVAIKGSIVIGFINWLLSSFFHTDQHGIQLIHHHPKIKEIQGKVIK